MKPKIFLSVLSIWLCVFISNAQSPMELVYNTNLSDGTTIGLPLFGTVNVTVDWGDGNSQDISSEGIVSHTYASEGTYTVKISGTLSHFGSSDIDTGYAAKLSQVIQWGDLGLTDLSFAFFKAHNLTSVPNNLPSSITSLYFTFGYDSTFNQDISGWEVSNVTNMNSMFANAVNFNQDLSNWDVSSVTNMSDMFYEAKSFNGNITSWNVSNVTDMSGMFYNAQSFNQDISSWNVSNVTDMSYMFKGASAFNQNISSWDVSNVTNMEAMFNCATSFDQNLGNWNITNVTNMSYMFYLAGLSTKNYDSTLIGWASKNVKNGVNFNGGSSQYSCVGADARNTLINNHNWTISDGGQADLPTPTITSQPSDQNLPAGSTATFSVDVNDDYGVSFQWQKDGNNLSDGGNISGANTKQLTITNISNSDEGAYICVITNCEGDQTTSNTANLTISTSTSIEHIQHKSIRIYPNPVKNTLFFDFADKRVNQIIITDMTGRNIFVITNLSQKYQMNLSLLPTGFYLIKIYTPEKTQTLKIIKE